MIFKKTWLNSFWPRIKDIDSDLWVVLVMQYACLHVSTRHIL